jgi:hypothetical protein
MAAEQLILVDAADRELGVGDKLQTHLRGPYTERSQTERWIGEIQVTV